MTLAPLGDWQPRVAFHPASGRTKSPLPATVAERSRGVGMCSGVYGVPVVSPRGCCTIYNSDELLKRAIAQFEKFIGVVKIAPLNINPKQIPPL